MDAKEIKRDAEREIDTADKMRNVYVHVKHEKKMS